MLMILILAGYATKTISNDIPRTKALRDAESYAIASCFVFQPHPYLKDQGDAWASVIIQRMKGSLDILVGIVEQVKLEIKKDDMAVI